MAMGSGMIKSSLSEDASFTESATQNITIHQRGVVLAKIVEYLAYKQQYANTPSNQVMEDFSDRIEPELALEL
ncbi:hypothetical protein QFC20_004494 [Naganishia adeliensis]|uniref:Uncharacterized protein n=1 Tax=Naganishia adeliensis TaxID=92952 RepID=A0ACC2VZF4_9TREE|nr:hypothetical protein QFC20_004494 [Naganishia adeliensis]